MRGSAEHGILEGKDLDEGIVEGSALIKAYCPDHYDQLEITADRYDVELPD